MEASPEARMIDAAVGVSLLCSCCGALEPPLSRVKLARSRKTEAHPVNTLGEARMIDIAFDVPFFSR